MIKLSQYIKVKDNYCLCYFGHSDEYLVQLRLLKPSIESRFPGINLCFGCKDDKKHLLQNCSKTIKISEIKTNRHNFAYIREIKFENSHPIESLLVESEIKNFTINNNIISNSTNICVIVNEGSYPTKPLERNKMEQIKKWVFDQGYQIEIKNDIKNASWVVGVESVPLFEAAAKGIRTTLIPTGVGTTLYKNMFSNGEIFT